MHVGNKQQQLPQAMKQAVVKTGSKTWKSCISG
jgi:hypothetical protein